MINVLVPRRSVTPQIMCVVLNFVTAYYDHKRGHYIYNFERIAINYLKHRALVGAELVF